LPTVSDFVRVVPRAVEVSNRTVPGTARRAERAPACSSLPAIEGLNKDIVRSDIVQARGIRRLDVVAGLRSSSLT